MKTIKWLLDLAGRKPLIFSLALLMIAITTLSVVVADRDKKLTQCNAEHKALESYYAVKFDSLNSRYKQREKDLSDEVKQTLSMVIDDYKNQIKEQKVLIDKLYFTIMENDRVIRQNKVQIQKIKK